MWKYIPNQGDTFKFSMVKFKPNIDFSENKTIIWREKTKEQQDFFSDLQPTEA